jgi:hypothetical protein
MAKAYAHKWVRVTISGTMHNAAEQWSTSFQMGSPSADMVDAQAPGAQSIATAWSTFWTTSANKFSYQYFTKQVKCALINEDGTTDVDAIDYYDYPSPLGGGYNTTGPLPPQIALAATLTSDRQRGLASKGRMYLPGISESIEPATGKLATTYVTTLATNFKTFLDAVNTAGGASGKVVLASAGHKGAPPAPGEPPLYAGGVTAWVTGCRIGNVFDTQRRRRNDLLEAYQTRVLA